MTRKGRRSVLIIEARFYEDIADELARGAIDELESHNIAYERLAVPGSLEIALAADRYDGFLALGCVIRGETTHYDYVCGESARGLMDLSVHRKLAIGYGIVTVNNMEQAKARAETHRGDKGGDAAHACLAMVALQLRWRNS